MAKNKYRNLWWRGTADLSPEYYENDAKILFSHRGVDVLKAPTGDYHYIYNGACIAQRSSWNFTNDKDKERIIDAIFAETIHVSPKSRAHIKATEATK